MRIRVRARVRIRVRVKVRVRMRVKVRVRARIGVRRKVNVIAPLLYHAVVLNPDPTPALTRNP